MIPANLLPGVTGSGISNYSVTFVGNSVTGNSLEAANDTTNIQGPYTLNFSGNLLALFLQPSNPSSLNLQISVGAEVFGCQNLNVSGNTMTSGGTGIYFN